MTEEKKTSSAKTTIAAIIGYILAALSFAFAIMQGGTAEMKIPCMDGGECLIVYEQSEGALDIAGDCKNFKEPGDECGGTLAVRVIYTKPGNKVLETVVAVPEPEKTDPEPEKTDTDIESGTDPEEAPSEDTPETEKEGE